MRHNVNILLGEDLKQLAARLAKYIHKHGEGNAQGYCRIQSWTGTRNGDIEIKNAELEGASDVAFISTIQDMFSTHLTEDITLSSPTLDADLRHYLSGLHQKIVTINDSGDSSSLLLNIYLPLYDSGLCNQIEVILNAISNIQARYSVMVVGLCHDLNGVIRPKDEKMTAEQEAELLRSQNGNIRKLADICRDSNILEQVVILQNTNTAGYALSLEQDSLIRIMGEFSLLITEKYDTIFTQAARFDKEHPLCSLGLSVLNLDKYYFEDYLLRRAYLHILDREDVSAEKVDINKVAIIADEHLQKHKHLYSDFYKKNIEPRVKQNESHNSIISETNPLLQAELDSVTSHLTDYISSQELTLPEKKALLAVILGYDDALLKGNLFNQEQLTLDSLDEEVANIFITENNKLVTTTTNSEGKTVTQKGPLTICCDENGKVELPIRLMQQLRIEIRESTNYIRQKTEELQDIEDMTHDAEESEKRFTEYGFLVDGIEYHFDVDHQEADFDETYQPKTVTEKSIDLRDKFTPIKDQGQIGACTVFAITSIFEYILKKNFNEVHDLSESFVYYNVRHAEGEEHEDTGSSYQDVIKSMGSEGICSEKMHPYTENLAAIPSDEAYLDGKTRRIVKAMNVKVNENDIKSAIQDGYPVAVSLKVYGSFSSTTFSGKGSKVKSSGFVTYPSDEEIASGEFGYHAMVIVGYTDDSKHFVVRNSWGKNFGDNGYCYIPYAYICDTDLNRFSCIVTEVNTTTAGSEEKKVVVEGRGDKGTIVQFNMNDAHIKTCIIKNLIDAEQRRLKVMQSLDNRLRKDYETLMQELGRQPKRKEILSEMQDKLQEKIDAATAEQRRINEEERPKRLGEFHSTTFKKRLKMICGDVFLFALWCLGWYLYVPNDPDVSSPVMQGWWKWVSSYYGIVFSITIASALVYLFYYCWWIKTRRRQIEMELEEQSARLAERIQKLKTELELSHLRFHVGGMIIDGLLSLKTTLDKKYNAMKSFIGNLSVWQQEEQKATEVMEPLVKNPFIPLLNNETLDRYFKENAETITGEMHLYEYFDSYQLDDEAIKVYKQKLKKNILTHISNLLDDFAIYRHISKKRNYQYLDKVYASAGNLLPLLDKKSEPFCIMRSSAMTKPQARFLFVRTDPEEKNAWQREYPQYFSSSPISEDICSNYKILELRLQPLAVSELIKDHDTNME